MSACRKIVITIIFNNNNVIRFGKFGDFMTLSGNFHAKYQETLRERMMTTIARADDILVYL